MVGAHRVIVERAFWWLNFGPDRQIRHRQKRWDVIARRRDAKLGDDLALAEERHQIVCRRLILCPLPNTPEIGAMRHKSTHFAPGIWKVPGVGRRSEERRVGKECGSRW